MSAISGVLGELDLVQHATTDEPGDAAHIVHAPPTGDETPQSLILRARVEGFEVQALCGYRWVPGRDPAPLPICQRCLEVYQQPGDNRDDRDQLPDA